MILFGLVCNICMFFSNLLHMNSNICWQTSSCWRRVVKYLVQFIKFSLSNIFTWKWLFVTLLVYYGTDLSLIKNYVTGDYYLQTVCQKTQLSKNSWLNNKKKTHDCKIVDSLSPSCYPENHNCARRSRKLCLDQSLINSCNILFICRGFRFRNLLV